MVDDDVLIATDLGCEGRRTRYYFIISSENDFSPSRKEIIRNTFVSVCNKMDTKIENFQFDSNYALIEFLVSIDVAVGNVIDRGIIECNKTEDFLRFHYLVTNTHKPDLEEIQRYLEELLVN